MVQFTVESTDASTKSSQQQRNRPQKTREPPRMIAIPEPADVASTTQNCFGTKRSRLPLEPIQIGRNPLELDLVNTAAEDEAESAGTRGGGARGRRGEGEGGDGLGYRSTRSIPERTSAR